MFCSGANIYMLGLVDPLVQGELLQVHERDAALPRGRRARSSGLALARRVQGHDRRRRLRARARVRRDRARRRRQLARSASPRRRSSRVLPGTGGLTRLVDKRKVRRDRADVFCTTAEGIKGKRAKDWGLVDRRRVAHASGTRPSPTRAKALAAKQTVDARPGVRAAARSTPKITADKRSRTSYVELAFDRAQRTAALTVRGPGRRRGSRRASRRPAPSRGRCARSASSTTRCSACASTTPTIGLVAVRTHRRRASSCSACDEALAKRDDRLRARGPPAPAPRAQAPRQHRAQPLRGRRHRRLVLRRRAARARARRRPLLHADRQGREDRASRPSSRTPASSR